MASAKPFNAVMHCSAHEFLAVNALATRVINNGVYINITLFPVPPVLAATFVAANTLLTTLIGQAKGNSNKVTDRDAQSLLVHGYMKLLIAYVNPIANHDVTIINQSGFDTSEVPMPTTIPETPVITHMEEGAAAGSYKVFLQKKKKKVLVTARPSSQHKGTRYTAQNSLTPTVEASWVTLVEGVASTKIIFSGLAKQLSYIRVYGVNAAGKGQPSAPFPFTPQ
jgi:hypothetical protein